MSEGVVMETGMETPKKAAPVPAKLLMQEAVGISIGLLVVFALIHIIFMGISDKSAMGHAGIFLGVALAGAITHFAFEYLGMNRQFVRGRLEYI